MSSLACARVEQDRHDVAVVPAPDRAGFRVLVVGHCYALRINQQKLNALARRCAAVGLLAPSNWRNLNGLDEGQRFGPERGYGSFSIFPAPVVRAGHVASFLFEPAALGRALMSFKPDIVQVEQEVYSLASAQLALAAKAARRRLVVFGWENLDRPIHPVQWVARKTVLALADAVVCGSSEGAALVAKWGFKRRIEVIPQLGVDPSFFRKGRRRMDGPFNIGFVGRLVREKGVDLLLAALGGLARSGLEFRATICGAGILAGQLELLARDIGIGGQVTWLGGLPHERIPEMMQGLDALVLPSRQTTAWKEQFGHVLIEAMAMGIPVVGSSSGAIPEVLGRQDLIFAEEDAAGLARILERLIRQPGWRQEVEAYGVTRVDEHYTHEKVAERLTTLWAEMLKG